MAIIEDDTVQMLLWVTVAVGALHVGTTAAFDYSLTTDLLMLGSTWSNYVQYAIGAAGLINIVNLATEVV